MGVFRIEEAIARAKTKGIKVMKKDISARLWPDSVDSARQVNMTKLCTGRTYGIRPEWVVIICEMCECTADYLFGLSND